MTKTENNYRKVGLGKLIPNHDVRVQRPKFPETSLPRNWINVIGRGKTCMESMRGLASRTSNQLQSHFRPNHRSGLLVVFNIQNISISKLDIEVNYPVIRQKSVHWPPTNQWTAALQPYSLLV